LKAEIEKLKREKDILEKEKLKEKEVEIEELKA
jgi:hypothetical protein